MALVREATVYAGLVDLHFEGRLSQAPSRFDAILIDGMAPDHELRRLSQDVRRRGRTRVLVDVRECPADRLWALLRREPPLELMVSRPQDDDALKDELARFFFSDLVLDRVYDVLHAICSPKQLELVLACLLINGVILDKGDG